MENEFVSYELALALKELGFDEPCFAYYGEINGGEIMLFLKKNFDNQALYFLAPLYQQAFRWFREKYNIVGSVKNLNTHTTKHEFYAEIVEPITVSSYSIYDTYEEAELECLVKLIEIVKS